MEFRFLRNENGDGTSSGDPWKNGKNGENGDVLHCRIERFGEEWIPKTTDPDYRKDEVIRDCIVPTLSRDSKSAFRGYTIELEIQERTDGLKFWRMVHDCKVTVNEQLNLPMKNMDLWNPGRKNIIYEKIILKSPTFEEEAGFIVPIHFVVLMCMMLYACAHQAQKRWRNECCRSCGKQLTFSAGDVCFWCSFYKANPTPMVLWEQMKAQDIEKRDVPVGVVEETFFEKFEHFYDRGLAQAMWGTTKEQDVYELERLDMEAGYRDRYPSGKPIEPSELFEKDTGITVIQKKLFDKFGKREFYPSYSPGSPAREIYNKKKVFQIGYHKRLTDKQQFFERMRAGELPMLERGPETDSTPDSRTTIKYFDGYGEGSGSGKKKKKKKKFRTPDKSFSFASGGDGDDDFATTGGFTKRIQFGVEDSSSGRGAFRPSKAAKPIRSALKSGMARKNEIGGGVKFQVGNQNNSGSDGSDDMDLDFDEMIDKAAGTAAARFGQVEDEDEVRERETTQERKKEKKRLDKEKKRLKKDALEAKANMNRATDRRQGGIVTDFDRGKLIESVKGEEEQEAKKVKGFFSKRPMSRWTKIANSIQEGTREAYIEKISSEPKNFMAFQRLGAILKKEADEEIAKDPVYAFQLFRCAALSLQRAVALRGVNETLKDPDFPWRVLGEVHLRSWLLQGIKGDRRHLEMSCEAWGYATRQVSNSDDPKCFVHHASALQFMGNYKQSGFVLGSIITKFPSYSKLGAVCMQACVVLKSLHQFKQAAAYLENVMKHGPPAPYTPIDCMFIMGRIYEEWGYDEAGEGLEVTSNKAYNRIFNALKTEEIIPSMSNFEDWFGDAITWCSMAEKCAAAGHYILASDFFNESIHRYEDVKYHTPLAVLHFENAKCLCRGGKMREAKEELQTALRIDQNNQKMFSVWREWEEPSHILEDQLKLPGHKFVKKLSELIPTVAEG